MQRGASEIADRPDDSTERSSGPGTLEEIRSGGVTLAYIVRADYAPATTVFVTPEQTQLQAGFVSISQGAAIPRHNHKRVERAVQGTAEALLVRRGTCTVDFYDDRRELTASRDLAVGDLVLLVSGGHGFRAIEDTLLLEIKQGPYLGPDDKERF